MTYMNKAAREDCSAACTACIHFDTSACISGRKFLFLALLILSLGCAIAFIMASAGAFHLSKAGMVLTGLGGSLAIGMLMLDCLQCMGCR